MLQAALRGADFVATNPLLGRLRPDLLPAPYRFWALRGFPFLLVYNGDRTPPRVLRMLHMARDLPKLLTDLD